MDERLLALVPAGYGHPLHRRVIRALMRDPDSLLLDCRLVPRSRWQAWSQSALQQCYGQRYLHVPALGNRRYREQGPIEIVDLAAGIAQVQAALPSTVHWLIVLCGCARRRCHRWQVLKALQEALRQAGMGTEIVPPELWAAVFGLEAKQEGGTS
ncbi:MAG: hypothetical protein IRZ31_17965 [Thermogemmatispora sp.]|uniref:hypothetical protein n=1 Tax=Thermogemmatispora sp. TaxID=1968838 RepID=UPI00263525D6|nr:hypothetical protein [Thermogemmatispora sp.]MBX5458782.1 hypothetical protein [Thermogemmatispora sp.]